MEEGNIVEFIDRQKIVCAVVQEVKNQRLRLLTENNREVSLSSSRLFHRSRINLDLSAGRIKTIDALKEIASRRKLLTQQINIQEIWEILNTEQEWIDLPTMTEFCFSNAITCDHESAVVRAFFQNRLYFKFDQNRFFPVPDLRTSSGPGYVPEWTTSVSPGFTRSSPYWIVCQGAFSFPGPPSLPSGET